MATKTTIAVEDDIDGGPAEDTVRFGLGAAEYEIDLNAANISRFREQLAPFVGRGRIPAGVVAQYDAATRDPDRSGQPGRRGTSSGATASPDLSRRPELATGSRPPTSRRVTENVKETRAEPALCYAREPGQGQSERVPLSGRPWIRILPNGYSRFCAH